MGERCVRNAEVEGSSPFRSTFCNPLTGHVNGNVSIVLRQPPVEFSVALFKYRAELAVLVSTWPGISESLKADILAMVRATGDTV